MGDVIPFARKNDPPSSHAGVKKILGNPSTYEKIVRYAAQAFDLGKPWTDTWMTRMVMGDPQRMRNVVARVRLEVQRDGWIEEVGKTKDEKQLLLFAMKANMRPVLTMLPEAGWLMTEEEQ